MSIQGVLFEEEQSFRSYWALLMLGVLAFVLGILGWIAYTQPKVSGIAMIPGVLVTVVMGGVAWLMLAARLTVRVEGETLHVRFFPFFTKEFALADVASWEARTYRPIAEYGGWGIRNSRCGRGRAYNMHGDQGVQLVFTDGRQLLIGSQRADELAAAIGQARGQR